MPAVSLAPPGGTAQTRRVRKIAGLNRTAESRSPQPPAPSRILLQQPASRSRSDYVPKVRLIPTTLDDLMNRAGSYADAVKAHVEYTAVSTWLMKADDPLAAACIPVKAGNLSVLLTRQALEHEAGWPKLSDNPVPPPLYDLPQDAQGIARRMAGDIHAFWEVAGRPYLRADDCKFAFQYLAAAIRKGIIPPIPTLGEVDPVPAAKPATPHILDMLKETS